MRRRIETKIFVLFLFLFVTLYSFLGYAGQCAGRCGGYDPRASCQCDNVCVNYGDCCPDICVDCPAHPACRRTTPTTIYTTTTTILNSCYDSDGGVNIYTQGYVYGYLNGSYYYYSDYCYFDGYTHRIVEYYCLMNNQFYRVEYQCPHGCSNGRCINVTTTITTTIPNTCSDTDGGYNIYQKGYVSGYLNGSYYNYADYCSGNYVIEYYCSGGFPYSSTEYCTYGCSDGRCIKTTTTITTTSLPCHYCYDSDNGIDVYTKGYVTGYCYGQSYNYYDYCSGNNVVEYYCKSDQTVGSYTYQCPYGCYDGRCINVTTTITTTIPNTCSDTDGGYNIYQKGYVSGYLNGSYYNYADYCSGNYVIEYYCSGGFPYSITEYCYYGCSDGRCLKSTWITTTTTTIYIPPTTITTTIPNTCSDTDGGYNIYVSGSIHGYYNSKYFVATDYCSGNYLNEYYCYNNMPSSAVVNCQYGCSYGACRTTPTGKVIAEKTWIHRILERIFGLR